MLPVQKDIRSQTHWSDKSSLCIEFMGIHTRTLLHSIIISLPPPSPLQRHFVTFHLAVCSFLCELRSFNVYCAFILLRLLKYFVLMVELLPNVLPFMGKLHHFTRPAILSCFVNVLGAWQAVVPCAFCLPGSRAI